MLGKQLQTAAAGNAGGEGVYVEDVFSTYLYTGDTTSRTITNGIDISTEGGLVWFKDRDTANPPWLFDTERGTTYALRTDSPNAQSDRGSALTSFNTDGFTIGSGDAGFNAGTIASWTFRKAEKFFDIVTYTGDGTDNRTISHNLGSVPGCIIVKRYTGGVSNWYVYHRSLGANLMLRLDQTSAQQDGSLTFPSVPTSTTFEISRNINTSVSGSNYVAYLFAHDEQIFGDTGSESVIKCGSYTGNGSANGPTVDLGWEPQFVLARSATTSGPDWWLIDNMRGWDADGNAALLRPNLSSSEVTVPFADLTSQGFKLATTSTDINKSGDNYIYIAIRRGPMKTPENATTVFNSVLRTGTGTTGTVNSVGFPLDMLITKNPDLDGWQIVVRDRLRGPTPLLQTHADTYEITDVTLGVTGWTSEGFTVGADNVGYLSNTTNNSGRNYINWAFRRAPGFFDMVAYDGNSIAGTSIYHNLGVAPELILFKNRTQNDVWAVGSSYLTSWDYYLRLHLNSAETLWTNFTNSTAPTDQVFTVGSGGPNNSSGGSYIAYLFATVPNVSKVGSYTGTGTTKNIDCGFTAGARFVMIKRTDSTGDWYVWDTARGIVSSADPYLALNSSNAEVTNTDYIDPLSTGFQISSSAPAAINANGGSYIFLAIA